MSSLIKFMSDSGRPSHDGKSDSDLLEAFVKQGDKDAFTRFVQRHGPMMYDVCLRNLREPAAAKEVFQSAVVVLARKAPDLIGRRSAAGYVYRVTVNATRRYWRTKSRHEGHEVPMINFELLKDFRSPDVVAASREEVQIIEEKLERLPEKYREPIILCCLEELSRQDAAAAMGLTFNKFVRRLAKGRQLLEKRLRKAGIEVPKDGRNVLAVLPIGALLPPDLIRNAVRQALDYVSGGEVGSATVAAIVEDMLRSAIVRYPRIFVPVLLLCGLIVAGVAFTWPMRYEPATPPQLTSIPAVRDSRLAMVTDDGIPAAREARLEMALLASERASTHAGVETSPAASIPAALPARERKEAEAARKPDGNLAEVVDILDDATFVLMMDGRKVLTWPLAVAIPSANDRRPAVRELGQRVIDYLRREFEGKEVRVGHDQTIHPLDQQGGELAEQPIELTGQEALDFLRDQALREEMQDALPRHAPQKETRLRFVDKATYNKTGAHPSVAGAHCDQEGRFHVYLYLDANGHSLNEELIRQGFGTVDQRMPFKLQSRLQAAAREGREHKRGLWAD